MLKPTKDWPAGELENNMRFRDAFNECYRHSECSRPRQTCDEIHSRVVAGAHRVWPGIRGARGRQGCAAGEICQRLKMPLNFTGSGVLDVHGDGEGQDRRGLGGRRVMVWVSAFSGSQVVSGTCVGREARGWPGYACGFLLQYDPLSLTSGVALDVYGDDSHGEWWNRG
ncbi:hypothetical protein D9611_009966 [Ephemerocybe angulata]|uniref:Uncharacterized protein n=1 Tax=Ephemerocybe angulata TaxID=980116 RepID=A0A8H5FFJ0_9AGAR|nr:hypothetical protein D9611_009966 [Tulosesus angulatus]